MNPFMQEALKEAKKSTAVGDIPVGCVIVKNGEVIARAHNRREQKKDPLAHAECEAIREAARLVSDWRLGDCDLYVTLEPCTMCAGAIINARMRRLYFGAYDPEYGAAGGKIDMFRELTGVQTEVYGGIMERECENLLKEFFTSMRKEKSPTLLQAGDDTYRFVSLVSGTYPPFFLVTEEKGGTVLSFLEPFSGTILLPISEPDTRITLRGESQRVREGTLTVRGKFEVGERIVVGK